MGQSSSDYLLSPCLSAVPPHCQSIIWIVHGHLIFLMTTVDPASHHIIVRASSYHSISSSERIQLVQEWKHACYQQCLVPVLDAISKPGLEYKATLDLDRRIRDFSIPAPLRNKDKLTSRTMVLQRASLGTALEAGKSSFFFLPLLLDSPCQRQLITLIAPITSSSSTSTSSIILHPRPKWARRGFQPTSQVRAVRRCRVLERFEDDSDCSRIIPK